MPELDDLTVRGFRSLADVEKVPLGSINVLIGANGSGKSNFIGVFSLLHAMRQGRLEEFVAHAGGADRLLHFGSKTTSAIEISISFQNEKNRYDVRLMPTANDEIRVADETAYFWDRSRGFSEPYDQTVTSLGKEAGISRPLTRTPGWIQKRLDRWRIYHFHDTSDTSPMKKTSAVDDNRYLRSDASNLAPFLYYLAAKKNDSYQVIRKTIQRVAPFFDDFQLEPSRLNPDKIKLEWRHRGSDTYFDAGSLSDGTLRFMALATLFLQPIDHRPSVIIVDEPEIGLHPYAITMLSSLIKQAAVDTQVIVSTQSSLLLDHFEPEDVLVAEREDGATTLRRLDPEQLVTWLEDFSLGQLWEKNEFGGRPGGRSR